MTVNFDPEEGLIVVPTRLWGSTGDTVARLAFDTGATRSLVAAAILVAIGYDPGTVTERTRVTTGSGVEFAPSVPVARVEALGHQRRDSPLLCHTLPPSAGVDGLLGLDFLRGRQVRINLQTGRLVME